MRLAMAAAMMLAGCAAQQPAPERTAGRAEAPVASTATRPSHDCSAEVGRLRAQLASETTERQRLLRAAKGREDNLRRQLDAMKSIERGILEREERTKPETR